jgi:hypothetical protein
MENSVQNSPVSKVSPGQGSPTEYNIVNDLVQKQRARIQLLHENIVRVQTFREKRTAEIASKQEQFEKQKLEATNSIASLKFQHEHSWKTLAQRHAKQLADFESQPLFDCKSIRSLSQSLSELRKENAQLRSKFAVSFAEIMDEIKANKLMVSSVCNRWRQAPQNWSHLTRLQSSVIGKCRNLQECVRRLNLQPYDSPRLELTVHQSVCLGSTEEARLVSTCVEAHAPQRILTISPFLAEWVLRNANLLAMQ